MKSDGGGQIEREQNNPNAAHGDEINHESAQMSVGR